MAPKKQPGAWDVVSTAPSDSQPASDGWNVVSSAPTTVTTPPASPPSFLGGIQHSFDENTRTSPNESLLQTGLKSVVGAIGAPFIHPLETAKGIAGMIPASPDLPYNVSPVEDNNPLVNRGVQAYHDVKDGGFGYAGTKLGGELLGNIALGEGAGAAAKGLGSTVGAVRDAGGVGNSVRNAVVGDPNAAALRGVRIGPNSPKTLSTLSAIEGARPFLKGATSLEDLQAKIPTAKSEIWSPYREAINAIGDKSTGFGTVADLENERLQNSALLRGLKSQNPEAIQLAAQKGLNQADLLNQESQLKALLDPELRATGIDPTAIRKSFGEVSRIGKQISGKSTLIEKEQPYGLGKVLDVDLHKPMQIIPKAIEGGRDILAGRPLFKGKPTDVSVREGFRNAGPKPDLGRVLTTEEAGNPFVNKSRLKASISR